MSRKLSLRGNFELDDNKTITDHQVFIYEAGDLTRGWEIESAYIWPRDTRGEIGSSTGQFQIVSTLATDTGVRAIPSEMSNAADNRQVGWCNNGYQIRANTDDFIANSGNSPNPARFVIDPNQIVQQGLWLSASTNSDATALLGRRWNYMIILKPKKLTAIQSILHMVKNRGQDIEN